MKKTLLSLLLVFSLLLTLAPVSLAASAWTEVDSAVEMAEALAGGTDSAQTRRRARSADPAQTDSPARVLLYADTLPDDCGAQRVLHYAAYREFVLEFASEDAAQTAYETLTGRYGIADCWLDTVLDGAEAFAAEPAAACASWGGSVMGLDTLKAQAGRYVPSERRVTVAVIDTGADLTIPQLQGRTISASSYDFANRTSAIADVAAGSYAGHGTKMASLIADLTPENVELMLLRVYPETGGAVKTTVITALQYALETGADVVNMSIGWPKADASYTFLNAVLDKLNQAGVPVICAAGNDKADVQNTYPANYSTTIAVSAFNQDQTFAKEWTETAGSCSGPGIDFSAPGTGIETGAAGGGTAKTSGTSLAAPHITAAVADILLAEPNASASQVYQTLRIYSRDLGDVGKDDDFGWGCPVMTEYFHNILCPSLAFSDMPEFTNWAHAGVDYCLQNGLLYGMSPTELEPNGTTTRAQFVTMLWRLAGRPAAQHASGFTDLTQDWYRTAVAWAVENNVVYGITEKTFQPDGAVTREQVAAFLYRYVSEVLEQDVSSTAALEAFPDYAQVSAYARPALAWANAMQFVVGVRDNGVDYLQPLGRATRAQVAAILIRFDLAQS